MTTEIVPVRSAIGDAPDLMARWVAEAQVKPASVDAYNRSVKDFYRWLSANGITNPTRLDVLAYRKYLGENFAAKTANLRIVAVRLFLGFLHREGYIPNNPAEHLKGFKEAEGHAKSALSPEMVRKIIGLIDTSTVMGKRDKALFATMVTAGIRCIEASRADIGDIEDCSGVMRLHVQGKGRDDKVEAVNLPAGVYRLIKEYLDARGKTSPSQPLFASLSRRDFGGRMSSECVSKIVKRLMRAAGYDSPRLTAHSLRHTAATTAIKAGIPIREVQQMLRHRDVSVTTIYLHELDEIQNQATSVNADKFGI